MLQCANQERSSKQIRFAENLVIIQEGITSPMDHGFFQQSRKDDVFFQGLEEYELNA